MQDDKSNYNNDEEEDEEKEKDVFQLYLPMKND